jgi:hypothetical protein
VLGAAPHDAVVAALDDVPGDAGKAESGAAGHGRLGGEVGITEVKQIFVVCPLLILAVAVGVAVWAVFVKYLHGWAIGVQPF